MPNLAHFTLKHKAIVLAATFLGLAWGMLAFLTLPRREDPKMRELIGAIFTAWPGATAEDVEHLVTDPLEEAVTDLGEVDKVVSRTTVGFSSIKVTLGDHIYDTDAAWDKVRAKIEATDLPGGTGPARLNSDFSEASAMVLALYQRVPEGREELRYSPRQMEIYADQVKEHLELIEAVAKVELYGVRDEVIFLEADAGTWGQLGLTVDDLTNLLQQRNIVAPGGSIDTELSRFNVKPTGEFNAVDEINRVVVESASGASSGDSSSEYSAPTYLKDLGIRVVRTYEDPPSVLSRVNVPGKAASAPCIVLSFTMKDGYNIVDLGQAARQSLRSMQASMLPADLDMAIVGNQPEAVEQKVGQFIDNLWQAVVVVVVVAFLMVGLRAASVMAASIPMVMIISIGISSLFNVEIETTSLAALIIALGMLVDCAIEVADNVHHHMHEGHSRFEATVHGTQQIAFPVLIGSLTTVAAFLPMLLIPGTTGDYIYSLPVVVSVTLVTSWFVAMTVTSLMAYWLIRPAQRRPPIVWLGDQLRKLGGKRGGEGGRGGLYSAICRVCVRFKLVTIGLAVAVFFVAASLMVTGRVGTQFFPASNRNQFLIDVYLAEGVSIARTNDVVLAVEEMIRKLSDDGSPRGRLKSSVTYVGRGGPRFFANIDPPDPSSNYAQIVINTNTPEQVLPYVQELRAAARKGNESLGIAPLPDARVVPRMLDMGPPLDSPIGIRLFGEDLHVLKEYGRRLKDVFREVPGTLDVHDTWGNPGYQLTVDIDAERGNLAGVSNYSIARTLNAYYSGHALTTFREGDHQVPVYLRLPESQRASLPDPGRVLVEGSRGKVPLNSVAEVREQWQPIVIRRYNRSRMLEVRARVDESLLANSVLSDAMPAIREIQQDLPEGYRLEVGGEHEETVKGQKDTAVSSMVSLGLILLLLVIEFNSVIKPGVILSTLPLAAAGSLFGLYLTGQPLGFMGGLGLMSLIGIVINDGIVLIEFVEHKIKEKLESGEGLAAPGEKSCGGLSVAAFRDCVVQGGRMRLLPISLTTLTTVGGLIPLALAGGPLFEPLAIVIIFGLLLGVFIMLFVLPAIYALFVERFGINIFPGKDVGVDRPGETQRPVEPEPKAATVGSTS